MLEKESPYIANQYRLADVLAAIQVMGTYRFSGRTVEAWSELLGKHPRSADTWLSVFQEHPEFFRVEGSAGYQTLVLRRSQPRVYDTTADSEISRTEFSQLPQNRRSHISRKPLLPEQILALADLAVKLHSQALERRRELRWWIIALVTTASSFVGALVAATVKVQSN